MSRIDYFYQNVGFYFRVDFVGLGEGKDSMDARFQSVSGFDVSLETESFKEGGENRFEHRVPVRTKYSDLTFKRGLLTPDCASAVTKWCNTAFDNFGHGPFMRKKQDESAKRGENSEKADLKGDAPQPIQPIFIQVILLNENHLPMACWDVYHAWPKAWKFGELNAEKSEVLLETLEIQHNGFRFKGAGEVVDQ